MKLFDLLYPEKQVGSLELKILISSTGKVNEVRTTLYSRKKTALQKSPAASFHLNCHNL